MEWIDYGGTWGDFLSSDRAKAGVLVRVYSKGSESQYLIGDINRLGGVCDDCMEFRYDDIVVRYAVLSLPTSDGV